MRISGIHIRNFLSFRTLDWTDIDPHFNVTVGPNGSGKSNLFRAIRCVRDVVSDDNTAAWEDAGHVKNTAAFEISLDIHLDHGSEQAALASFVRAAFTQKRLITDARPSGFPVSDELLRRWSEHLVERWPDGDMARLFKGRLMVAHQGVGNWDIRYVLDGTPTVTAELTGSSGSVLVDAGGEVPRGNPPLFTAWIERATGSREALNLFLGEGQREPPTPTLAVLFAEPSLQFDVEVSLEPHSVLPTQRALREVLGYTPPTNQSFRLRGLLGLLLQRAVLFTDNVRVPPKRIYPLPALADRPVEPLSGEDLGLHLMLKKNGGPGERAEYAAIQKLFQQICGRRFDLGIAFPGARLRDVVALQQGHIEPDPEATIEIQVIHDWGEAPLALSGAGIGESLFLASTLVSRPGAVILLDEPAANLYPSAQRSLIDLLTSQQAVQFFVSTHSPFLIRSDKLPSLARFSLKDGASKLSRLGASRIRHEQSLLKVLRQSPELASALFAERALLFEGGSELAAVPLWYLKSTGHRFDEERTAVLDVGGHYSFGTFVEFCRTFEIPWAIVCDGSIIADASAKGLEAQLRKAGVRLPKRLPSRFEDRAARLQEHGVFTLVTSASESFEEIPGVRLLWAKVQKEADGKKPLASLLIAERFGCPPALEEMFQGIRAHFGLGSARGAMASGVVSAETRPTAARRTRRRRAKQARG